jgi:hypothetical protein
MAAGKALLCSGNLCLYRDDVAAPIRTVKDHLSRA